LSVEQVIWIRHPNPVSPYESSSLIEAAAYEIDVNLFMQIYRKTSLEKGGFPNVFLSSDQELDGTQADEAERRFKAKWGGLNAAGALPVLGKGVKPGMIGLSAKDLAFIEGSEMNATEIMRIFGVLEGMIS